MGSVVCDSEDLSEHGVFVRTDELLPIGTELPVHITLPNGEVANVWARVCHLITPSIARGLGRHQGMGLEIMGAGSDSTMDFSGAVSTQVDGVDGVAQISRYMSRRQGVTPAPVPAPAARGRSLVHVIEPSAPLRSRLVRALEGAGFLVDAHESAMAGLVACETETPDVVVSDAELDDTDGLMLVQRLAMHPALVHVPVVLLGDDHSDLARLEAYRAGVREYIPKPFLDEELLIRVHRLSMSVQASEAEMSLRGSLADVSVQTLITLFEFERKSGLLMLMHEGAVARLLVNEGRIIQVDLSGADPGLSPRQRMFTVLDWRFGNFEFASCSVSGDDEVQESTTAMLLEHARVSDERGKSGKR